LLFGGYPVYVVLIFSSAFETVGGIIALKTQYVTNNNLNSRRSITFLLSPLFRYR